MPVTDLEQAAHGALVKLRAMRERMETAEEGCDQSEDRLGDWTARLDADLAALQKAVETLGQTVETRTQEVADEVVEAETALAEVAAAAADAGAQGQQLLQAEAEHDAQLGHHLDEVTAHVTSLADTAEASSQRVIARAGEVADVLTEATKNLEQLLRAFATVIEQTGQDVENTATAVRSLLDDLAPSILADEDKEFEEKTGEARALVDRQFPAMGEHAAAVAEYSVETMDTLVDTALDAIELEERTLETGFEELTDLATEKESQVTTAGDGVAARLAESGTRAEALERALVEIRGRWITFGFTV